jgi:hypothetical protein
MLSQKHNTFHWPEEETPLHQEQAATATSSWQGWSLWLRILGIVITLVALLARVLPIPIPVDVSPLGLFLPVLLGASLIRSWWTVLIVPVAFSVALFLGTALASGGFDHMHIGTSEFFEGVLFVGVLVVVPVTLDVLIGTPIGKWIEKRLRQ